MQALLLTLDRVSKALGTFRDSKPMGQDALPSLLLNSAAMFLDPSLPKSLTYHCKTENYLKSGK